MAVPLEHSPQREDRSEMGIYTILKTHPVSQTGNNAACSTPAIKSSLSPKDRRSEQPAGRQCPAAILHNVPTVRAPAAQLDLLIS